MGSTRSQLQLNVIPRIAYVPEYFVVHGGVEEIVDTVNSLASPLKFCVLFVHGGARSGKSHLALRLSYEATLRNCISRVVDGVGFADYLSRPESQNSTDDILIVDDAHEYLSSLQPGGSGKFVDLIERARSDNRLIVLLSNAKSDSFDFDGHVRSRLLEGMLLELKDPREEDIVEVLSALARQRGIALSERKAIYLSKRVGRSICELERYLDTVVHLSQTVGGTVDFSLLSDAL